MSGLRQILIMIVANRHSRAGRSLFEQLAGQDALPLGSVAAGIQSPPENRHNPMAIDGLTESGFDDRTQIMSKKPLLWPEAEEDAHTLAPNPVVHGPNSLLDLSSDEKVLQRLGAVDWSFSRDKTNYLSHDIHPYPAKFIPQIPANLVAALSIPGELVWDPFGGSGTTAFEALRLGRRTISTDANPVATEVASAKCLTLTREELRMLDALADRLLALAQRPRDLAGVLQGQVERIRRQIPLVPNINKWFTPRSQHELAYIISHISDELTHACQQFARVCFSSIVLKASAQDSETRYACKPKALAPGDVLKLFARQLSRSVRKHLPLQHVLRYRTGHFATLNLLDAEPLPKPLTDESVDLIVTSPPYANATDYHLYHRFRLFWLGHDPRHLSKHEIGSHLRHQREQKGFDFYLEEMTSCLRLLHRCLRPGRFAALVVGSSRFGGHDIDGAQSLATTASNNGWEVVGLLDRPIHRTKRSFISAARRANKESILLIRKPARSLMIRLFPPNYSLFPYEECLAADEFRVLTARRCSPSNVFHRSFRVSPYVLDRLSQLTFTHHVEFSVSADLRTWQAVLENGYDAQNTKKKKEPKYCTHGIHPYKGKFYPQLARCMFNLANASRGAVVLDPFCGSGTVLLESTLNGLRAFGVEMNPLGVLISRAKTQLPREDLFMVDECLSEFLDLIARDKSGLRDLEEFPAECLEEIRSWFPSPVARCLAWLLRRIESVPLLSLQDGLRVCLSSVVREVSQQEPRDLRIRRRAQPIENAPTLKLFRAKVQELRRRLREFAERLPYCPFRLEEAEVIEGDSRTRKPFQGVGLSNGSVDLVVTSPPYATALPYIDTDRLSLLTILGMPSRMRADVERRLTGSREIATGERRELEAEMAETTLSAVPSSYAVGLIKTIHRRNSVANVGFRRRNMSALLLRYYRGMTETLRQLRRVVKPRGSLFFVLGNSRTIAGGKETVIDTTRAIREISEHLGFGVHEEREITVTRENLLHAKNAITRNTILWLEN